MKNNFISIGKILNFHGVKGEAKLGYSKNREDFLAKIKTAFILLDNEYKEVEVAYIKFTPKAAIIKFKGIDSRRVIVDETAPLYYIGLAEEYQPMLFIVGDNDMENRLEQTELVLSTLKHFEHSNATLKIMNGEHCQYVSQIDENSNSVFGKIVYDFINKNC